MYLRGYSVTGLLFLHICRSSPTVSSHGSVLLLVLVPWPCSLLDFAELVDVAANMGISIHMYADDTQLYIHCKPSDTVDAVAKLERCIAAADKWMMAASRLTS